MIRYIKKQDLDIEKYDFCIENSLQNRIYALSWYLDIVADNWDALVLNDYEAVMPIPWKQKFFLKYITQPYFCQQLGIFSKQELSKKEIKIFINNIPSRFVKIAYQLNSKNSIEGNIEKKVNYILCLDKSYEVIKKGYRKDRKYRVNQVNKKNYSIDVIDSRQLITLAKEHYSFIEVTENGYKKLEKLMTYAVKYQFGFIKSVSNAQNELLGGCFFLKNKDRIVYLFSAMTPEGKKSQIASLLIDSVIKEYENTKYVFDFEGSMLPSIASFFKSFGAEKEEYPLFKKYQFPFFRKSKN